MQFVMSHGINRGRVDLSFHIGWRLHVRLLSLDAGKHESIVSAHCVTGHPGHSCID